MLTSSQLLYFMSNLSHYSFLVLDKSGEIDLYTVAAEQLLIC